MKKSKRYIQILFWLYIGAVLWLTLMPESFNGQLLKLETGDPRPFAQTELGYTLGKALQNPWQVTLIQLGGNFVMLLPLGLISAWRRQSGLITAVLFGVGIELTQFVLSLLLGYPYRTFDVDDLWINALGVFAGWLLGKWLFWYNKSAIRN